LTIVFHTRYPNTPALFTFYDAVNVPLTTSSTGDLTVLEVPDGTYPYTIVILGKTYQGNITVTNNEGYVDVDPLPPSDNTVWLIVGGGVLGIIMLVGIAKYKRWI
jgi:ABC-type transport system substrate-binding protein